jgi:hypothetical protein
LRVLFIICKNIRVEGNEDFIVTNIRVEGNEDFIVTNIKHYENVQIYFISVYKVKYVVNTLFL